MSQFQNNKPFLPFNFRLQHFNLSKLKLPSSKFEMHRICVPIVQCLLGLLLVSSLPDEMLQPLTPESFQQYAQKMQSDDMIWLSQNTKLFNFETSDNFTLQGYMVDVTTAKKQSSVLVYCSGWTETTIKYAKFLRRMHNYGFQIFSYDLRGQGFSDPTSWDGGMVTHTTSLEATYVSDLEYFVQHHVIPAAGGKKLVFCANSFSGLIGLSLQLKNRDMFAKVVVLAPCILPNIDLKTKYQIKALRWIGFESSLLIRMNSDPTDWGKPTTHAESRWKEWQTLRSLVPQRLQIAGPSVAFLDEMLRAGEKLIQGASAIKVDLLVIQAETDDYVDNSAMAQFFSRVSSPVAKMVRLSGSWHEILIETDDVFDAALDEMLHFIGQRSRPHRSEALPGPQLECLAP